MLELTPGGDPFRTDPGRRPLGMLELTPGGDPRTDPGRRTPGGSTLTPDGWTPASELRAETGITGNHNA